MAFFFIYNPAPVFGAPLLRRDSCHFRETIESKETDCISSVRKSPNMQDLLYLYAQIPPPPDKEGEDGYKPGYSTKNIQS